MKNKKTITGKSRNSYSFLKNLESTAIQASMNLDTTKIRFDRYVKKDPLNLLKFLENQ